VFAAILTTILFSISAVCGHRSSKLVGGTEANFWRISVAAVVLGAWAFTFGQGLVGPAFPIFLLSGIVGIGLGDVAFFQALPRLGSRLCLLLVLCLTAPLGALIEWLWLDTPLSLKQILSGLTILAGVGIALAPDRMKLTRSEWTIGILAGVLSALGGAGGAVLSRKAYQIVQANAQHIDGLTAGFQRVFGGWFLAGIWLLIVKRQKRRAQTHTAAMDIVPNKWRSAWLWILLNSLAGQILGVSCMLWALKSTPTGIVLSIIATAPVVVIPIAFVVEGERPTLHSLIGGVIAIAGVIALTLAR
jgi:drug/metabolite transporter (DMT)-like permease